MMGGWDVVRFTRCMRAEAAAVVISLLNESYGFLRALDTNKLQCVRVRSVWAAVSRRRDICFDLKAAML